MSGFRANTGIALGARSRQQYGISVLPASPLDECGFAARVCLP